MIVVACADIARAQAKVKQNTPDLILLTLLVAQNSDENCNYSKVTGSLLSRTIEAPNQSGEDLRRKVGSTTRGKPDHDHGSNLIWNLESMT